MFSQSRRLNHLFYAVIPPCFHSTVAAYFRIEFQKSKAKAKTRRVMTTCEVCLEKTPLFSRSLTTVRFTDDLLGHKSLASSESLIMNY